MTNNAELKLLH